MFGCYGIITCCYKSYHKATVKFSSNPTISFSRNRQGRIPPWKVTKTRPFPSTCYGYPSTTEVPPCCQAAIKKLTFSTTSVLLLLNVPLSLSRGTFFRRQTNPRRGYRPKTAGILFVCNEPEGKYYTVPEYCHLVIITALKRVSPSGDWLIDWFHLFTQGKPKQSKLVFIGALHTFHIVTNMYCRKTFTKRLGRAWPLGPLWLRHRFGITVFLLLDLDQLPYQAINLDLPGFCNQFFLLLRQLSVKATLPAKLNNSSMGTGCK